jgi:hypothetical protein
MKLSLLIPALALALAATTPVLAAPGEQQPAGSTCTCKKCGAAGADGTKQDVTGQCGNVCKGKEVYSKGSEAHDYCKAAAKAATAAAHGAMQSKAKAAAAPK